MSPPAFSVILCTYNRGDMLDEVLKSLDRMDYPRQACEIIVVDNASIDQTRSVAERWQEQGRFALRYVYEERQGLSHARNTGVRESGNHLVAFIDDDSIVDPTWLAALADVFENDRQVVCVGGRIELLWEASRPPWLSEDLEGYLGRNTHLGNERRELPAGQYPFGGNMAIKRLELEKVGGFDAGFGRIGMYLGANEEMRVADLLRKNGKIVYTPSALVWHLVPAWRSNRKYLIRRSYYQGIANANFSQVAQPRSRWSLIRSSINDCVLLCEDFLAILYKILRGYPNQAFSRFIFSIARLGQLKQTIQIFLSKS